MDVCVGYFIFHERRDLSMTQVKDLNRKRVCDISDDGKSAYIRRGDCITKITADTDGNLKVTYEKSIKAS